jgi:hypothetical protein
MDLLEGQLRFSFAAADLASKYDTWAFYRNQFQNGCGKDNKAVDMVASIDNTTWLIEVKDYRQHQRTKVIDLAEEVALKVRDTLAGLVAARSRANDPTEKSAARALLRNKAIRVVLHLEQAHKPSRLRPRSIEPDKLLLKLKSLTRALDPHPLVVDTASHTSQVAWHVAAVPASLAPGGLG